MNLLKLNNKMNNYYYIMLHNGKLNLMNTASEIPKRIISEGKVTKLDDKYSHMYSDWIKSFKPCEIKESEFDKITRYLLDNPKRWASSIHVSFYDEAIKKPIEVTDIIEEKSQIFTADEDLISITFKQPIEFNEDKNILLEIAGAKHANNLYDKYDHSRMEMEVSELFENKMEDFINGAKSEAAKKYHTQEADEINQASQEKLYEEFAKMIMCGGLNLCKKYFILSNK